MRRANLFLSVVLAAVLAFGTTAVAAAPVFDAAPFLSVVSMAARAAGVEVVAVAHRGETPDEITELAQELRLAADSAADGEKAPSGPEAGVPGDHVDGPGENLLLEKDA